MTLLAASIAAATKAALGDGALPISINDNHHLHHFVVRLPSRSLNGGAAFAAAPAYWPQPLRGIRRDPCLKFCAPSTSKSSQN
jgi:hypothetical protein